MFAYEIFSYLSAKEVEEMLSALQGSTKQCVF